MSTDHTNESPLNADFATTDSSNFAVPVFEGRMEDAIPRVKSARDSYSNIHDRDASNLDISNLDLQASPGPLSASFNSTEVLDPTVEDSNGSHPAQTDIDAIEFRVIRTGSPVRRLRLTGNRYTFGSAEGCSIRLSDSTLRPMHAVLIRDAVRVLVRAYSVPIDVNGTRKTEATLQVGDSMRLGAYEFELVSVSNRSSGSFAGGFRSAPTSVFDQPAPTKPITKSTSGPKGSISPRSELPSAEDLIWRERLRREIDQWRERQIECDQREQRCDQREAHLRGRETELWSRVETLHRRESRLQSQESAVLQLHDDYAQRQQDLIQLRDHAQTHQETLRLREAEFRHQELEYRVKLEEASRQLHQSQQQAESATLAVKRMREQFDSLNRQIDELSSQQHQIEQKEKTQSDEHRKLRVGLEQERDEAIEAQTHSEALRREAESRLEEMEAQLKSLRSGHDLDFESRQAELDASERLVEELRQQVSDLQSTVSQASEESSRLRHDYEEACQSVRQLESLVAQSSQRGDVDRESWTIEADELRAAIDQLSLDLARANGELSELSETNHALTLRLDQVQQDYDEAQTRPTHEAFESLRQELDSANLKLSEMKREYDGTMLRLAEVEAECESQASSISNHPADTSLPAIGAALLGFETKTDDAIDSRSDLHDEGSQWNLDDQADLISINAADVNESESIAEDSTPPDSPDAIHAIETEEDDDVWPTYQMAPPTTDIESEVDQVDASLYGSDDSASIDLDRNDESESLEARPTWQSDSAWAEPTASEWSESDLDLATPPDDSPSYADGGASSEDRDYAEASANNNDSDPASEFQSELEESSWSNHESVGVENADDDGPALDSSSSDVPADESWSVSESLSDLTGDEDSQPASGFLASQLINDLDADSDGVQLDQDANLDSIDIENSEHDDERYEGTYVMPLADEESAENGEASNESTSWDREYQEEALAEDTPIKSFNSVDLDSDYQATEVGYDRFAADDRLGNESENESSSFYNTEVEPEAELLEDKPLSEESEELEYLPTQQFSDADAELPELEDPQVIESVTEAAGTEDDDSIEAYMNRLLNRVQGSSGSPETTKPETVSLSLSRVEPTSNEKLENKDSFSVAEVIDPNAPLVPRSQAPERNSDLSAMRKLANDSARGAISHSARIQTRNIQIAGLCNLAVAAAAVIAALLATFMLDGLLLYVAWLMALVIAGISVRDAMGNFAEAKRRLNAGQEEPEEA